MATDMNAVELPSAAPLATTDTFYLERGAAAWRGTVADVAVALAKKTINAQTGTTYTLALTDIGKLVTLTNGSAITLTIPLNSSVAFPTGSTIDLAQLGAGTVTVAAAGGVTLVSLASKVAFAGQYGRARLVKTATNTWLLDGDLA